MDRRWLLPLSILGSVAAQNGTNTTDGFPSDPILALRPSLAHSLPVQLLLTGIVLTLMSVLLLQLLFTAQYHCRLALVNFSLQISAVVTLLVTCVSTVYVVMSTVDGQSQTWPYMLNYVAVNIPPEASEGWSLAGRAAWLLMQATTGMLIQCTHIQFLTLLFPSKLERRLIFLLLGPLALTSAAMQLIRIQTDWTVQRIAQAVQSVCNATLSLLFTVSLFLWGLLVNRKNAWRMDGGTAAFGAGALMLAPMSTAIALIYIPPRDHFSWMKPLMWSIILWQSFLGWWWWVGAGMGVGELDELLSREEKRQNKRKRRSARRKEQREKAETLIKGVADAFSFKRHRANEEGPDAAHSPSSPHPPSVMTGRFRRIVNHSYNLFLLLRHEHLAAEREQAAEWGERINQVYGREGSGGLGARGWGLGEYGVRRMVSGNGPASFDHTVSDPEAEGEDGDVDKAEKGVDAGTVGRDEDGVHRVRRRNVRQGGGDDGDAHAHPSDDARQRTSMWWWGPLRQWRLQDTTEYS
ncbi:hypothetical protein IEO21_06942 [Rhodonia placenta]|uniref:Uncharacterized protein n=1 Tax=Rhodonia placenta TaxID=104341 RepID=A0A8H7NZ40_9APHY|nr:hypothetical protein IEO21_06942 [Postia placenta]